MASLADASPNDGRGASLLEATLRNERQSSFLSLFVSGDVDIQVFLPVCGKNEVQALFNAFITYDFLNRIKSAQSNH